jgi:hypothetical protein
MRLLEERGKGEPRVRCLRGPGRQDNLEEQLTGCGSHKTQKMAGNPAGLKAEPVDDNVPTCYLKSQTHRERSISVQRGSERMPSSHPTFQHLQQCPSGPLQLIAE